MFSFNPTIITKKLLLEKNSEETYFAFYGIPVTRELFKSPLRADHNPTCSFYRSRKGELYFKDFSTGDHFDFVNLVQSTFNVNFQKALKIIANDFGIINKPHYVKNERIFSYEGPSLEVKETSAIRCEIKDFSEDELKWWLKFGITKEILEMYNVYSVKHVFLNGKLHSSSSHKSPVFGYYFGNTEDGIEKWKIYYPNKRKHRFLLNCSEVQGLNQLDVSNNEYLVVTKSLKDVMTLRALGISAIATQGESILLEEWIYDSLADTYKLIIFNGDWDPAGKRFMVKSLRKFKGCCMTFKNKAKYGKDISDFIAKYGIEKGGVLINTLKSRLESGMYNHQLGRWQKK